MHSLRVINACKNRFVTFFVGDHVETGEHGTKESVP